MSESVAASQTAKLDSAGDFTPSLGTVGRFRILRPIARGGLGEVYLARDLELNREVALKEIRGRHADNKSSQRRFIYEAEITGSLEHPGIIPVYGLGAASNGRPFYAMRFIRGESLKAAIDRFHAQPNMRSSKSAGVCPNSSETEVDVDVPSATSENACDASTSERKSRLTAADYHSLEFRKLLGRFIDVCNAVAFAHDRGILHRDIKPDNVMLGPFGETLLVDWGLAKVVGGCEPTAMDQILQPPSGSDRFATLPGSTIGTPRYMSPEQAKGAAVLGPSTDIFSLGATLYTILTKQAPIEGATLDDVLANARQGAFPPVAHWQPSAPKPLAAICAKAMAYQPDQRYESAQGLASDIDRWLADREVSAFRDPPTLRLARWARGHKALVAATAVGSAIAIVALTVGLLAATTFNRQLASANRRESQMRLLAEANATEAERRRAEAESERESAQAVRDFLQFGLLRQADPIEQSTSLLETPGSFAFAKNPTVRQLLERAAAELAGEGCEKLFPRRPLLQAEILRAVGDSFLAIGEHAKAIALLERAQEIATSAKGGDLRQTRLCTRSLAMAYREGGKYRLAIAMLEPLRRIDQSSQAHDAESLATWFELSECRRRVGDPDACAEYQELLQAVRANLGETHVLAFAVMHQSARCALDAGDLNQAVQLFSTSHAAIEKRFGKDHPNALIAKANLGSALRQAGDAKSRLLLEQAAAGLQKRFEPGHPELLKTLSELAILEQQIGNWKAAIGSLQCIADGLAKRLGATHPETLVARNNLALARGRAGDIKAAADEFEVVLATQESTLGASHASTLATAQNLALACRQLGRFQRSGELFERLCNARKQQLGDSHPLTIVATAYRAIHWADVGQSVRALRELEAIWSTASKLSPDQVKSLTWIPQQLARLKATVGGAVEATPSARRTTSDD